MRLLTENMALKKPTPEEQATILRELCGLESCQNGLPNALHKHFLKYYQQSTGSDDQPENLIDIDSAHPPFVSHRDILDSIKRLHDKPRITKSTFKAERFPPKIKNDTQERGMQMAVQIAFMVNPSAKDNYSEGFSTDNYEPANWEDGEGFFSFLERTFPVSKDPEPLKTDNTMRNIKAWKMKKRYGIKFIPTNDLSQHMLYDNTDRTVKIFRHIAWLKGKLRHTQRMSYDSNFETSVKANSLPPQLLFETLVSIHMLLFPVSSDKKSRKLVRKLIHKHDFDPDLATFDKYIRQFPTQFAFHYWADRLRILQGIVNHPPPTNSLVAYFERHTSERNALTVAIFGVFLAALFGFLGCAVGVAQLVIAVLAWKHPAPQPGGNDAAMSVVTVTVSERLPSITPRLMERKF